MAKSMLPKSSTAKAPGGKPTRSKRATTKGEGPAEPMPESVAPVGFGLDAGAFTVESFEDPGPKRERYTFAKIADVL
jgi:hypothetical protein